MKFFHHTGFQARKRVLGAMLKDFRHRNAVCLNKTDRFRFCLNKNKVSGFIFSRLSPVSEFMRPEIGRTADEVIVDTGDENPAVNVWACGEKCKISATRID